MSADAQRDGPTAKGGAFYENSVIPFLVANFS